MAGSDGADTEVFGEDPLGMDEKAVKDFSFSDTVELKPATVEKSQRLRVSDKLVSTELDRFIAHLADACPLIAYDDDEDTADARYVMGSELGSGAIGQVIEAHDEHLSRTVAVKILRESGGIDREKIARFISEAQITAQLEHPTIVPVHEIGRMPGGMPYFTMKTVRGKSLNEIINELRILPTKDRKKSFYTERIILRRFVQLCFGVAYAHSKGVVHRDLKPENIMLGEYGEVQIMDWGLAKVMSGSTVQTRNNIKTIRSGGELQTMEGSIAGTPSYMSPEQARGDQDAIGPASDIFTLGLILAEVLTLIRVFRGSGHPSQLLQQISHSGPIELSDLSPGYKASKELEAIVRKCTMNKPEHRYQTADEVADDIRAYLENREISAEPDQTHKKVLKWTYRHPLLTGMLLGFALAVAAGGFVYSLMHQ